MKPATKRILEARIREQYRHAQNEDEQACEEEGRAYGRRVHANECREVAAELQALLDAALAEPEADESINDMRDPHAREVQHIDTPDEEPAGIPPHVWLYRNMLTDLQAVAPLGRDETNGQYAVAIDQLTPEQAVIPHVVKQLVQIRDDIEQQYREHMGDLTQQIDGTQSSIVALAESLRKSGEA